jgi:hypothetical protein
MNDRRERDRRANDRQFLWLLIIGFTSVFTVGVSAGVYIGAAYSAHIVLEGLK